MNYLNYNHINIIGYGYVGSSFGYLCKENNVKFSVTDLSLKSEERAEFVSTDILETIKKSETSNDWNVYIVCVPTPSLESGECDTSIVSSIVKELSCNVKKSSTVFIKSTIQPRTSRMLHNVYSSDAFDICFLPEFLTERSAHLDMYNANFALIGTADGIDNQVYNLLLKSLYKHKSIDIYTRKYEVCEMFKYTVNVFLATKVWFFNEICELAECMNFEYSELQELLKLDPRIGESHTLVPGPDGKYSFGGSCFPKDTRSLRFTQHKENLPDTVLTEILKRSEELRKK